MSKAVIKVNDEVSFNLPVLIETKLAVLANSGGGKSYAIRRIIEQAFGKVQIIVLDPEGEYGNLREKYDFVLAGEGGETIAKPHVAGILAKRLLELKASAIIDLYDLIPQDRKKFVRLFLESLMNLPKELRNDCIIILDEAHVFAPEGKPSEATSAVEALASQGRKRGLCAVFATQRIAKMSKDVLAECNNKMIGRMNLDIDRKRAAEELGFTSKEQILSLRNLKPGEFHMFGPAISDDVILTKVGEVTVPPPKRGSSHGSKVVPPTAGVKKLLAQLSDLPQEAEKEAKTATELKQKVITLEGELKKAKTAPGSTGKPTKEQVDDALRPHLIALASEREAWKVLIDQWDAFTATLLTEIFNTGNGLLTLHKTRAPKKTPGASYSGTVPIPPKVLVPTVTITAEQMKKVEPGSVIKIEHDGVTGPEQRILDAIAWCESIGVNEPEQVAVAFLAGYTYGGGGFNNPRGSLRTKGLVEYRGDRIALSDAGRAVANAPSGTLTREELHQKVLDRLPGPEKRLLTPLLAAYPEAVSNEELAEKSGYQVGSGGFNNPKGRLRTLGLVEYTSPGFVRARDLLFP